MSSIRPLATITVLALVGAFLYAKINETEPQLPEGVDDWNVGELDFDMGGDGGGTDAMVAPQFGATNLGATTADAEAPAFGAITTQSASATATESAPAFAAADTQAAPAWTPAPVDPAPPAEPNPAAELAAAPAFKPANTHEKTGSELGTASLGLPDLPPLPAMPPSVSENPIAEVVSQTVPAHVAVPNVTSPQINLPSEVTQDVSSSAAVPPSPVTSVETQAQSSLFSATRLAVQAALDRGELSQALLLLSDWYGDPSLTPSEAAEVDGLLGQLAGSVIYSTEPRLAPPYRVQAGERLEDIAKEHDVPWQLLAKINGITSADQLQPGQKIKVLRGPFSAVIDISKKTLTLMLDRRYAGKFALDIDPSVTIEAGHWQVEQKLLTPGNASLPGVRPTSAAEERSLMLSSANGDTAKVAVLRGTMSTNPLTEPAGRILRMKPSDAEDVFDILSKGSKVVIRR